MCLPRVPVTNVVENVAVQGNGGLREEEKTQWLLGDRWDDVKGSLLAVRMTHWVGVLLADAGKWKGESRFSPQVCIHKYASSLAYLMEVPQGPDGSPSGRWEEGLQYAVSRLWQDIFLDSLRRQHTQLPLVFPFLIQSSLTGPKLMRMRGICVTPRVLVLIRVLVCLSVNPLRT